MGNWVRNTPAHHVVRGSAEPERGGRPHRARPTAAPWGPAPPSRSGGRQPPAPETQPDDDVVVVVPLFKRARQEEVVGEGLSSALAKPGGADGQRTPPGRTLDKGPGAEPPPETPSGSGAVAPPPDPWPAGRRRAPRRQAQGPGPRHLGEPIGTPPHGQDPESESDATSPRGASPWVGVAPEPHFKIALPAGLFRL